MSGYSETLGGPQRSLGAGSTERLGLGAALMVPVHVSSWVFQIPHGPAHPELMGARWIAGKTLAARAWSLLAACLLAQDGPTGAAQQDSVWPFLGQPLPSGGS